MNKHMITGTLAKDPVLRPTSNGSTVTNFRVASERRFVDKNGDERVFTDYLNCVAFGAAAESFRDRREGDLVEVVGRVQTRSYDKDGGKVWVTETVADFEGGVAFLSSPEQQHERATDRTEESGDGPDDNIPF